MNESLRELWGEAKANLAFTVPFSLDNHTMAVFRVGSHSHGTYVAPTTEFGIDDVDLMVIVCPPAEFKLGLQKFDNASYRKGRFDVVIYDYEKWMTMLLKQNPNVIGTLFLEPEDRLVMQDYSHTMWKVINNSDRIVSRKMATAFLGYAQGQMYKMTHQAFQGYMGDKRKMLVEQFGYDTKNAAHMIRLLRMCIETLNGGRMQVRRPDAAELVDIKQGKWTLQQVMDESERLVTQAREAEKVTLLPERPDQLFVDKLIVSGYLEDWRN